MKLRSLLLIVFCSLLSLAVAEDAPVITNKEVVSMVKAGMPDANVGAAIQRAGMALKCDFDLSDDGIRALKSAGVSDYLLQVMTAMNQYKNAMASYGAASARRDADTAPTNSWRGLVLDVATPEDAIAKLGPAQQDLPDQRADYFRIMLEYRIGDQGQHRGFRELVYSADNSETHNMEGMKEARLFFLNNKLVLIHMKVKDRIDPNQIGKLYGAMFEPSSDAYTNGTLSTPDYFMVAELPKSWIWAKVDKRSLKGMFAKNSGSLGGFIWEIQLVSSTLRNDKARKALE